MLDLAVPDVQPPLQRAHGAARLAVRASGGRTVLDRLYQAGSARIRLPKTHGEAGRMAVLINTAGGLTGGDRMSVGIDVDAGAHAIVVTQASEKIYRASAGTAVVATTLALGPASRLDWLPQETIFFDGAALTRRLDIDMAEDARLTAVEAVVFGRAAMDETVTAGAFRDRWRIRRAGRLAFADDTRLDGPVAAILGRRAVAGAGTAIATVVHAAADAPDLIGPLRNVLDGEAGASIVNGLIVARIVAPSGQALRATLASALAVLRGGAPLPRVWTC